MVRLFTAIAPQELVLVRGRRLERRLDRLTYSDQESEKRVADITDALRRQS